MLSFRPLSDQEDFQSLNLGTDLLDYLQPFVQSLFLYHSAVENYLPAADWFYPVHECIVNHRREQVYFFLAYAAGLQPLRGNARVCYVSICDHYERRSVSVRQRSEKAAKIARPVRLVPHLVHIEYQLASVEHAIELEQRYVQHRELIRLYAIEPVPEEPQDSNREHQRLPYRPTTVPIKLFLCDRMLCMENHPIAFEFPLHARPSEGKEVHLVLLRELPGFRAFQRLYAPYAPRVDRV